MYKDNVLSMRDYLKRRDIVSEKISPLVISVMKQMAKILDNKEPDILSLISIQEAIHYQYITDNQVTIAFETKAQLFKMLKTLGLGDLLSVKYCNLDSEVMKEFFKLLKKED